MYLTTVTEIDFRTYVAQARMFLEGERHYDALDPPGGSGPCVYPAGHLYVFALLDRWSQGGTYLFPAQLTFGGLYLATSLVVSCIYYMVDAPPVLLPFLILSKRLHSIYMLRMFNDPVAMFAMYVCIYLLCRRKWSSACFAYSYVLKYLRKDRPLRENECIAVLTGSVGGTVPRLGCVAHGRLDCHHCGWHARYFGPSFLTP